jgi:uncharacterized protein (DUF362 family)
MKITVVANSCDGGRTNMENEISAASAFIGLKADLLSSKVIFLKPNLTYPVYKEGVTTRKEFVEALVKVFLTENPKLRIYIGEGEGGYNSFSIAEAFKNMGFYEIEKKYPQAQIINLSKIPSKEIEIDTPKGHYKIALPEIFFNEIDFSISCPVPKVHCMTKVTLSYKNQWGCLPDIMRLKNHFMLDYIISKVSDILKFKYAFLDGKYGLTNNGPMVGDAVEVNWFAASNSLGAFDMIVSEMMGFDWKKVGHLRMAEKYGFIPGRSDIKIIGDIEALKKKFRLKRDFWNYPALAAFHSKGLTQFVYLSKWAKLVHDVMYAFRKRPIQG